MVSGDRVPHLNAEDLVDDLDRLGEKLVVVFAEGERLTASVAEEAPPLIPASMTSEHAFIGHGLELVSRLLEAPGAPD